MGFYSLKEELMRAGPPSARSSHPVVVTLEFYGNAAGLNSKPAASAPAQSVQSKHRAAGSPQSRRTEATMSTTRSRGKSAVIPSACACRREISSALRISRRPDRHRPQSPRHPAPCLSSQFPDVLPKRASPMTDPAAAHRYRPQQEHRRIAHRRIGWMPVSSWQPRSC
jgi:hypothetical protein